MNRKLVGVALSAVALFAAGCGGNPPSGTPGADSSEGGDDVALTQGGDIRIAMVTHSDEGSFWSVVKQGAEAAAEAEGVQLTWSPSDNDPERQAQLIDTAVSEEVDGIAVSVPNPDAIRGSLQRARQADIPIITLNSGADVSRELGAITHVGQDEVVAGRAAGQRLKSEGAQKVLCIIHEQGNVGLEQRCRGVQEGFGSDVENFQVRGTEDVSTTQTEIQSKLQADDSFDAVMTLNPDIADAAETAISGANSEATLATFDQSGPVIDAIEAGDIAFAVDQQQYLQGYLPVTFLKLFLTNANTVGGGQAVLTGPGFVDRENAATIKQLAADGTR